ncbi:MAG: hypothetical protein WCL02_08640 [bacterium]
MREDYSTYLSEIEPTLSFATEELTNFFEEEKEIPTNEEPLSDE